MPGIEDAPPPPPAVSEITGSTPVAEEASLAVKDASPMGEVRLRELRRQG